MMRLRLLLWPIVLATLAACNGKSDETPTTDPTTPTTGSGTGTGTGTGTATGTGTGTGSVTPTVSIDLRVDTNRDGVLDPSDDAGEDSWGDTQGAGFLANLDDDDGNGTMDADDPGVQVGDVDDLARLEIVPWADASAFTPLTASLSIDPLSVKHVRVFREGPTDWVLEAGSDGPCGAGGDPTCPFFVDSVAIAPPNWRPA